MLSKYHFELALERVAEKFYFHGATQYGKKRGGNSSENEAYFRSVATDLRDSLKCQQILIKKGACPDSGIFGDFGYKNDEDVAWDLVKEGKIIALEFDGVARQKRYIEVPVTDIGAIPESIKKDSGISIHLNRINGYGEFFGVEYKASKSNAKNSITVASFNSTCPSGTKTVLLKKVNMYHNLKSKSKPSKMQGHDLKIANVNVSINFSIYYLIVNDYPEGQISEIKQIFVCDGSFFAPNMTEEEAKALSKQLDPVKLEIPYSLYRVGLRYRPFFDSKTIRANGYGLYTSWEPKIPGAEAEERQRELLLKEVEKIQQTFDEIVYEEEQEDVSDDEETHIEVKKTEKAPDSPDNVIYLTLREDRIKKRAA
jgi:hypothetical protein